jgi:hypothetical protein
VRDTTADPSRIASFLRNATRLAQQLEVEVSDARDPVVARRTLELLSAELARALDDPSPAQARRIAALLEFLGGLDSRLATGRVRSLSGLRRQCEQLEQRVDLERCGFG